MIKRIAVTALVTFTVLLSMSLTSQATPVLPGPETSLQTILNDITVGGNSSVNVNTDQVSNDAYWSISGGGGSVTTFLIELAGYADLNTFGIFSGDQKVELFGGAAVAGDKSRRVSITTEGRVYLGSTYTGINFAGNLFGYYIGTPGGYFYSDTAKNSDGYDHMVAFQGNGTDLVKTQGINGTWMPDQYILAFEDLPNGGDKDYNDLAVMVKSVKPVPEPAISVLIGIGMVGSSIIARRRKSKSRQQS